MTSPSCCAQATLQAAAGLEHDLAALATRAAGRAQQQRARAQAAAEERRRRAAQLRQLHELRAANEARAGRRVEAEQRLASLKVWGRCGSGHALHTRHLPAHTLCV